MPIDESDLYTQPRSVKGANFSRVKPTPLIQPFKGVYSDECLNMIGLADHKSYN